MIVDKEILLEKLEALDIEDLEEEEITYLTQLVKGDMPFTAKSPTILKYSKAERYDG